MRSFKQELVGLFGKPVGENPTQVMVEAAFGELGLDWRYLTLEVEPAALGDAVRGARAFEFRGFHCTIPHKVAVIEHLDRISETAASIGAVNCVVREDDGLVGENTDGKGFLRALNRRSDPAGQSVVVLGAGGAARAIAVELLLAGAQRLVVVNRSEERGRELAGHLRALAPTTEIELTTWQGDYSVPAGTDLVVNATPIGLYPDVEARVPLDLSSLTAAATVADVVPNPPETAFLREARGTGCPTIDGLEMLVEQGVLSVGYWTGREPDAAVMQAALAEVFAGSP
jgi:shikimate dehydrogenase